MQRFGQLFLTILMVVSLVLIPLKKHWFETVDRTFVFDNSQQKFNIKEIAVVGFFKLAEVVLHAPGKEKQMGYYYSA